jgi:hypothetical protein
MRFTLGLLLTCLLFSTGCAVPSTPSATVSSSPTTSSKTLTKTGMDLIVPVLSGDRVELTVTAALPLSPEIVSKVKDPYGNVIAQTLTRIVTLAEAQQQQEVKIANLPRYKVGQEVNRDRYPWHYAFIAATSGDYRLEVRGTGVSGVATLTAIINP